VAGLLAVESVDGDFDLELLCTARRIGCFVFPADSNSITPNDSSSRKLRWTLL
jgi:hypothetical protein